MLTTIFAAAGAVAGVWLYVKEREGASVLTTLGAMVLAIVAVVAI